MLASGLIQFFEHRAYSVVVSRRSLGWLRLYLGLSRHTGKKVQDRLKKLIQIEFQSLC